MRLGGAAGEVLLALLFGAALAPCLLSCGAAAIDPERGPAARRWRYRFELDPNLTRLSAEVCFEGPAPWALRPIEPPNARYVVSAEGPLGPIPVVDRALDLRGLPEDACVRYEVDLDVAARERGGIHGAYRIGEDLVASTAVWLWMPRHRAPDASATARFVLPPRVRVSALWSRAPGGSGELILDERSFSFVAYAAFGRFETHAVPVPGACLRVTVLGRGVSMGDEALRGALAGSARAAAMAFGRFPVRDVGVLAVPTPFSSSSPFGIVGRGSLPTVAILVGERATPEALERAWVPVHEFSHLATPYIDREDAWLSEGIATYYQEVLRARAGLQSSETTWRNLDQGFARGARAGSGRTLLRESRDMGRTAAYRRVYWAGAAVALMADVAMRQRSEGARSLDDALEQLAECCAERDHAMRADEVMARLDAGGAPIFTSIARRELGNPRFPDLSATYAALGLLSGGDGALDPGREAEADALREAILMPPPALASAPDCAP